MDDKYQKYYNALNGKDFSNYVQGYLTSLSEINSKFASIKSMMASSSDKGLNYIKSSIIPYIDAQESDIEQGLNALKNASSKCVTLVELLNQLKNASDYYNSCSEEEKEKYRSEINSLKYQIDVLVSEINAISLKAVNGDMNSLLPSSIETLRANFIGNVDNINDYYIDPSYANKAKELVCFDNTTGQILKDADTIYLKPGETRILTVRLPYNAGAINKLLRTTADGGEVYRTGSVVTARSDVNPDPSIIDYVNYKENAYHMPSNVNLHTNYYDWVITAKADGTTTISQTCEYTNVNGDMPKAMVELKVVVNS